jgi:hypothetical protein
MEDEWNEEIRKEEKDYETNNLEIKKEIKKKKNRTEMEDEKEERLQKRRTMRSEG